MADYQSRATRVQRYIPDSNLRKIIFNHNDTTSTYLDDDKICINYFSNTLIFIFFFLYKAFINWKKNNQKKVSEFSSSMIRIYNILNSCYVEKKVTYDLIDDLIINLQIDSSVENGGFLETLGLESYFLFKNSNLSKYIYMIKQKRISSRYMPDFNFEELISFFAKVPLLHNAVVDLIPVDNLVSKKKFNKIVISFEDNQKQKVELNDVLLVGKRNCIFLEELEFIDKKEFDENKQKNQRVISHYLYFESEQTFTINYSDNNETQLGEVNNIICYDTAVEDLLLSYDMYGIKITDMESYFFKDYIFFNNQYVKNIALVISDTMNVDTKNKLLETYKTKYIDIFNKLTFNTFNGESYIRWDEVLIFLLIEEGIYSILKLVLEKTSYEALIKNFTLRFGENAKNIINNDEDISNPNINLHYKNDKTERKIKARALISLATKLLSINEVNIVHDYSAASIRDMIEDVDKIYNSNNRTNSLKISYFITKVIDITLFLESFYRGLLEYIVEKSYVELPLENRWFNNHQEYVNAKKRYLNKFAKASTEARHQSKTKINNYVLNNSNYQYYFNEIRKSIEDSFDILLLFNEEVSKRNTEANAQLFEATGKRTLFNKNDIIQCKNILLESIDKCLLMESNKEKKMVDNIYKATKYYLEYLRDGSLNDSDNIEDSIYPIVSSYSNGVISKDGYRYSYIFVNQGFKEKQVKVISDDEFEFDEFYYCVPNINRIANIKVNKVEEEKIWINPIIIPYHLHPNNMTSSFERLENEADYDAVSELIYNTDQKIYQHLFGSLENAKQVLRQLYNRKSEFDKTIFHKEYIYILKTNNDNNILAIATCYDDNVKWNSTYVLDAFEKAGIEIPDTIEDAFYYFKDTFEEFNGENKNIICDLIVKKEYRNTGLGKLMLNNLIKQSRKESRDLVITVYEDNYVAFNLYSSLGFIPYTYNFDNRAIANNKEKYYKMIKFITM